VTGPATWTVGSVPYAGTTAALAEDNPNHFWDGVGHSLGLGTTTPIGRATVSGATQGVSTINTAGSLAGMLVLDDTGAGVGAGGTILFTGNTKAYRFGAIRGYATSGGGNSTGDITISTRRITTDTTLTEAVRVQANGFVGVGTPAGTSQVPSKFVVATNTVVLPVPPVGTLVQIGAADTTISRVLIDTFANAGAVTFRRANTTALAPSALAANDLIGGINATGYGTSYGNVSTASMGLFASEAFTATAQGSYITLNTTLNGTITPLERVRVYNDGGVTLGAPTGGDKGTNTLNTGGAIFQNNVPVLTANQTITLTGDVTGSGTTSIATTLATVPVAKGGTNKTSWVAGSVAFAASTTALGENNAALFWDNPNGRLGVGTATPRGTQEISSPSAPLFIMTDRSGATDAKAYDWQVTGGQLQGRCVNDAYSTANQWVTVTRSGAVPTSVTFPVCPVAVGTGNAIGKLTVTGAGQGTAAINTTTIGNASLLLDDTGGAAGNGGSIIFSANSQGWRFASIQGVATNGTSNTQGNISFSTRRAVTDATLTESVRIDPSGNLSVVGSGSLVADSAGAPATNLLQPYSVYGGSYSSTGIFGYNCYTDSSSATRARATGFCSQWNADPSSGQLTLNITAASTTAGAVPAFTARMALLANGTCYNQTGSWSALSDASIKSDVQPYERGLDAIMALEPVAYRYNEKSPFYNSSDPVRYGLVADQVRPHVPEAVGTYSHKVGDKEKGVDLATLDPTHLVYVLINAVKAAA
jgi:hypothetical protein